MEREQVSVSAAADVAKLPKAEQVEIVARGPDEIVREANRIKREKKEKRREERRHRRAAPSILVTEGIAASPSYSKSD